MLFIVLVWVSETTILKKDALYQTAKAKLVAMIANSEIDENGKIFSHFFLVYPAGFLKNHLPPSSDHFFEIFIVPSEKGQRDKKLSFCKYA